MLRLPPFAEGASPPAGETPVTASLMSRFGARWRCAMDPRTALDQADLAVPAAVSCLTARPEARQAGKPVRNQYTCV